jgi:alkaline phosphatase
VARHRIASIAFAILALAITRSPAAAGGEGWLEAGREAVSRARELEAGSSGSSGRALNAILFLGDGMGVSTVTAARILEGQLRGQSGEENWLAFERLPYLSLVKTYNVNQQTPDSAGTITAIVTGTKTRAGVLSVDETVARGDHAGVEGHRLLTILEQAEQRGLSTGVVTTAGLTHATPAACYAHSPERDWEVDASLPPTARAEGFPDIARQLIEFPHGDGPEVALGGGRQNFLPRETSDPEDPTRKGSRADGRDLTREWLDRHPGAAYVWDRTQFEAVEPEATDHLLGLFEPSHMRFEADRAGDAAGEPSLSEMTAKAIEILSRNRRGYFLLVEGGRIDHAHHWNNAYRALTDTIEFSNAVRTALEKTDPAETLVVVTADHSHVFTIAGYPTRGNDILGKVISNDERGEAAAEPALDARGLPYTTLGYQNGPGAAIGEAVKPEGVTRVFLWVKARLGIFNRGPDLTDVETAAPGYLQQAAVPMWVETHGGEDVAVYAGGPGARLFHGVQEQTYVYHAMVEALGWRSGPQAVH